MSLPVIDNIFISCHLNYKSSTGKSFLRLPSAIKEEEELKRKCEDILNRMGLGSVKMKSPATSLTDIREFWVSVLLSHQILSCCSWMNP